MCPLTSVSIHDELAVCVCVCVCVFIGVVEAFDKAWQMDKANCANYYR